MRIPIKQLEHADNINKLVDNINNVDPSKLHFPQIFLFELDENKDIMPIDIEALYPEEQITSEE